MISDLTISLTPELQQLITTQQAWHYGIVPHSASGKKLELYMEESKIQENLTDELELLLGKQVTLIPAPSVTIQSALSKYYRRNTASHAAGMKTISAGSGDDFLPALISEARELGSSDIHLEVFEEKCRVRIRIDGQLIERHTVLKNDYPSLVNKIKIKAGLDIAEKRLPQDGRIFFNQDNNKFDIRVSVLPSLHGEKVVLRLLGSDASDIDIHKLGMSEQQLHHYIEATRRPNGIILISGPTGSGKTTTLYATMRILNRETVNILTVEDPIEYTLEGVTQVQVKESIGLTFANALRTFLRQDPDIIMLGEIRDVETAQMAVRLSLTGHLVLSTIHTNSAWGTVSRLSDMGVPSYLLASTLNTTVAQRLVRLLCPFCKKEEPFKKNMFPGSFTPPKEITTHHLPAGCGQCYYTGYKGRKAVYEVIPIDYDLSEQVRKNQHDARIVSEILKTKKIITLSESAFELFESGETSLEEIYPLLMNSY